MNSKEKTKDYPYGYCGMPCALCTRYHIEGPSRCLGCTDNGYYTDNCKVNHCCKEKGLLECALCSDYPCKRLGNMKDFSNLNTNNVKMRTGNTIKELGFDEWYKDYTRKSTLLKEALKEYNDGRMKRYLCELFIQEDLATLTIIMDKAKHIVGDTKTKGKVFKSIVEDITNMKK